MNSLKNWLCLFGIFISTVTIAQQIDWHWVGSNKKGKILGVEELSNENLFTIFSLKENEKYHSIIKLIDKDGEELDSKLYEYDLYETVTLYSINDIENETIMTFSSLSNGVDSFFTLITVWDNNLNILNEHKYYVGEQKIYQYQGQWTGDYEAVVVGSMGSAKPLTMGVRMNVYFKLNEIGEVSILRRDSIHHVALYCHDICRNLSDDGYIGGGVFMREFDDSLQVLSEEMVSLGQKSGNQFTMRQWTDSTYIFAGSGFDVNNPADKGALAIVIFDENMEVITNKLFGDRDLLDFGISIKGLDGLDKNNMYFVGGSSFVLSTGRLKLINFDEYLNVRWEQDYKVDSNFKYQAWKIVATSDGGCVIVGEILSPNSPFMLKVSNTSLGTSVLPEFFDQLVTLYPNPSPGVLRIDITGNTELEMQVYEMQGICVYKRSGLQAGVNTFDDIPLSAGSYVVKLMQQDGTIVSSQQWIKW